jgi:RHS repeat-associated protein
MVDGWVTAGYNALNQAVMINTGAMGGNWMFFGYDPLGRCVKRWSGGLDMSAPFPWIPAASSNPATYFYYDGWSLIQEGPNASAIDRVYMLGNRVDEIVTDYAVANGQWMFHTSEARGDSMLLTDWNGNLTEQYYYDAFGYPYFFSSTGQPLNSSTFGNRFLFTGREWLSDLKLYGFRNRMYQPELGRFMQPDPKEFAAGDYNLYRYCHNDPINLSDPTGLAYVSSLTSWGGGDWSSGIAGMTNRDRDLINRARLVDFLLRTVGPAAKDAARASHTQRNENGGALGQSDSDPNDLTVGASSPNNNAPERINDNKGRHGLYNTTDFTTKPLPPGYHPIGGYWGLAIHQSNWPRGDRRSLYDGKMHGVLGIPAGAMGSKEPEVKIYIYEPGHPPPLD